MREKQLEQGGFAGTITADDPHNFAAANGEGDILGQGPKYIFILQVSVPPPRSSGAANGAKERPPCVGEALAQGLVTVLHRPDPIAFGQSLHLDRYVCHLPAIVSGRPQAPASERIARTISWGCCQSTK